MDCVILYDVSWKTYQSLLNEREERQTPRLVYDRGALEILSVLTLEHRRRIARLPAWLRSSPKRGMSIP